MHAGVILNVRDRTSYQTSTIDDVEELIRTGIIVHAECWVHFEYYEGNTSNQISNIDAVQKN